jgi:hypothetical protein
LLLFYKKEALPFATKKKPSSPQQPKTARWPKAIAPRLGINNKQAQLLR